MRFSILFAALVSASCVVPVDVPHPGSDDGGVDAGTTEDAGSAVDAGVVPGSCSVPADLGLFVAKTTKQFVFPGCATATFSSEPGVSVVTRPNSDGSATVEITPSTLGAWVLTFNANASMQTRELLTDEQFDFDAGFVRRYPDRVDGALTVMPGGRLVTLGNSGELTVYAPDAGIEQTLPANPWPHVWAGNVLWVSRSQTQLIERWVETPAGVVSTGTFDATGANSCHLCRVEENRVTSMIGTDLVEFTWDAGSFSKEVLTSGLQLYGNLLLILPETPDKVWASDFCSYEPGCTTMVCPAIQTCLNSRNEARVISATAQHALVYNGAGGVIQLWALPFSLKRELHARPGSSLFTSPSIDQPTLVQTGPLTSNNRSITSEVVIHRNRIVYRHFGEQTDLPLIVTTRWVVRIISPRELQFIPR